MPPENADVSSASVDCEHHNHQQIRVVIISIIIIFVIVIIIVIITKLIISSVFTIVVFFITQCHVRRAQVGMDEYGGVLYLRGGGRGD